MGQLSTQFGWSRLRHRFRRAFPLAFLILAGLAFLGGALYAPSNYDGLTYRGPRILHWLAAGQWHWIHTIFPRVNARACGIEWVSAPVIAFTKTDRLLFLINIISFLLMPGLVYSVFTRLGVRRRVAWHWMWIVPSGYCFVLQAGSLGNDLFGAPFVLAALDFALRAKISRSSLDLFASLLAVALMTSAKTSDLPLLLPWGLAIFPTWRLWFRRPLRLAVVCLIAFGASFLPTAMLNAYYCGDWTGWKAEGTSVKNDPLVRLTGNVIFVPLQNLVPPVFPQANRWNQMVPARLPASFHSRFQQTVVEPGIAEFRLEEMQIEENAGLGLGICWLVIISVTAVVWQRRAEFCRWRLPAGEACWLAGLRWTPWVSLLALLSQSEVYPIARILAPYYSVLLPGFLALPGQEKLLCRRWWRAAAAAVFLMAGILLVLSPPRPLFPARTIFAALLAHHPQSPGLERAETVYTVYHNRSEAFAPVLARLPPDLKVLGLFTYDDPETSLWRPFGSRRIEHICPGDTAEDMRRRGIHFVLIPPEKLKTWFKEDPAEWVRQLHAEVVQKIPLQLRIQDGVMDWWLVKLP